MKKRLRVIFSGHVQGVGFRFMVRSLARTFRVTGWTRNGSDGSVEVLAEQEETALSDFVARIEGEFQGYIRDKQEEWGEATEEFADFGIRM